MNMRIQTRHLTVDFVSAAFLLMNPGKGITAKQAQDVIDLLDCESDTFKTYDLLDTINDACEHIMGQS